MVKKLILGVGNLLLTDEGIGIHAIQRILDEKRLEEKSLDGKRLGEDVEIVDGGTAGLALLYYLEGVETLVIIDAVETGGPPGTIVRLAGDRIPAYMSLKVSPHEITLPDFLAAARLRDLYPKEVIVWGMQPRSLDVGIDLSPDLEARLDTLVGYVVNEVGC
jgi:hydrogenase maturation protease